MEKIIAGDAEARSVDVVGENIARLRELFPELVTETVREGETVHAVDVEVLKQLVGDRAVRETEEKYGLNWHGKRAARRLALTPSTGTLRPCPEDSVDWDTTQNLMIEGDNLEVLKLLQKSYAGKVKLIYIDPPYNTGKDFVYPDNFRDNIQNYLELTGQTEGGAKITSNPESSGRFHTDWLNMLFPRLKLAWSLLRPDGVVFVSIDEKEVQHLRILANELFGEENFVANVSVVTNLKGRNDKKHIAACHEQVVIYGKPAFVSFGLPLTDEQRAAFKYSDEKGQQYALRDLRKRGGPDKREDRPNMHFPIYWSPAENRVSLERQREDDIEILPLRGDGSEGCWRWGKDKVRSFLPWIHPKQSSRSGRLDVDHRVYLDPSVRLVDTPTNNDDEDEEEGDEEEVVERTSKPKSIWLGPHLSSDNGKRAMKELIPGDSFDFPKSVEFLRQCIQIGLDRDGIGLDLFAGSGTFGQSVMQQNKEDGANRRFVLIQLPEPLSVYEKDQKAAAQFCDEISKPRTIAELTKERLRRAGKKIKEENPMFHGDVGFRVFKLDTSNIRAWDTHPDDLEKALYDSLEHIKHDRSEQDVLYELLLKLGLDLCVPIETREIAGKTVHSIGAGTLIACLDEKVPREEVEPLALGIVDWHKDQNPAGETVVVFRDSAFSGDDVAKTNLTAILEQNGIGTVRSL